MMTWYSQAGQDEWVHSIVGDTGFFVDVGAHDGIVHSNTYALEQLGWTGICIEPDPTIVEVLRANRSCHRAFTAVSDHKGYVRMVGPRVVLGPVDHTDIWCDTLTGYLEAWNAPPVIDYLSIDVEGHERQVLAGMNFDRWSVRLITIEHNAYCDGPDRKEWIFNMLTAWGFERVREDVIAEGYGPYEDWYQAVELP